jgi:GTP-binding protein YchF
MPLHCGIIGITNSGKTTLFNCMSNTRAESTRFAFSSNKSNIGLIHVPDQRLEKLAAIVNPKKITPATIDIVDIPGLTRGSSHGEGIGNTFLSDIRNTDALIHVLRCFDDPMLPHIEGSVDPVRDKETVDLELQIKDLESVEKKIQKLDKLSKMGEKDARHGKEVLEVCKQHLGTMQPVRTALIPEAERIWYADLCLLTAKPVIYVCNVDESSALSGNNYVNMLSEAVRGEQTDVLVIAGAFESEIAELESPEDRSAFLEDAGLKEPGVNRMIRSAYSLLNQISFFTAAPKEVRAWTIRKGMTVQQAAGVIHSDLERGFIRAEVIKMEDYLRLGSEHSCKEAGKIAIEGKNYIVEDGDVIYVRFNV